MIENLKEAIELVKKYRSITIKDIRDVSGVGMDAKARHLTGFGSGITCSLCSRLGRKPDCTKCIYRSGLGCLHDENAKTYNDIDFAKTPKELKSAFRARANHIDKMIKKNTLVLDDFMWQVISYDEVLDETNDKDVYLLHDDGTESLIEDMGEVVLLNNNNTFRVEL